MPDTVKTAELDDIVEWLGELVRQVDSSLLDEWEALSDPGQGGPGRPGGDEVLIRAPDLPRPFTVNQRALRVAVRGAMWRRVQLAALGRWEALAELDGDMSASPGGPEQDESPRPLTASQWRAAGEEYHAEYADIGTGPDARGPQMLVVDTDSEPGYWLVEQILDDPDGDRDWRMFAEVDLAASDEAGELVLRVTDFDRR